MNQFTRTITGDWKLDENPCWLLTKVWCYSLPLNKIVMKYCHGWKNWMKNHLVSDSNYNFVNILVWTSAVLACCTHALYGYGKLSASLLTLESKQHSRNKLRSLMVESGIANPIGGNSIIAYIFLFGGKFEPIIEIKGPELVPGDTVDMNKPRTCGHHVFIRPHLPW